MLTCPACAHSVTDDARFCPTCGRPIDAPTERLPQPTVTGGSSMLASGSESGSYEPPPIDHGSFLPGTIIAKRYRIVGLLGKGAFGEVYRTDDLKLGQTVALKFLAADLSDDPYRRDRFHAEVRIARQVTHPNVCRVFDIGEVDGRTYLSMEYVDGEDLSSLLRRIGRVSIDKAIEIARQLCTGLAAAHARGVLHRDLKPANIMIDGRGRVRITDFGLAALGETPTGAAARAGTPAYMSPEQFTEEPCTVASDLYAVGLVLYEVISGRRVFDANRIEEYRRLHTEKKPTSLSHRVPEVEPEIEQLISQCLEKDPAKRPASAHEILAALPGGDPLSVALAAGETPSPELVAAAAPSEGMPQSVSLACLIAILLGMIALPFVNDRVNLYAFAPLAKPPIVLVDRARQVIEGLGYTQPAVDSSCGFEVNDAYLSAIETRDASMERWSALALGQPAAVRFWYRESPRLLIPSGMEGTVTLARPPPTLAGMTQLRLDSSGRLLSFRAVPPERERTSDERGPIDWMALVAYAGLMPEQLTAVTPTHLPPVYCDERAAWLAPGLGKGNQRVRVEAAAYHGRPVYFELTTEWEEAENPALLGEWNRLEARDLINVFLFLITLLGAAALARRNLALGRGDRRGARRMASFVAVAFLAAWACSAHHVPDTNEELRLLAIAVGRSLTIAGACWLLYIALEPYIRQRWPDMLISWNRLLVGRFRDPVIGRDILLGGLFGILGVLLITLLHFAPGWFGAPPPRPTETPPEVFLGFRYGLGQMLQLMTTAVLQPMLLLLLLLLLLVLLRNRYAAIAGFFALLTGAMTLITLETSGNVYVNAAVYGMLNAAMLFVLLRFGMLAVMLATFYILLLRSYPITADLQVWYAGSSLFAMFVAAALAIFGYVTAAGGRSLLHDALVRR